MSSAGDTPKKPVAKKAAPKKATIKPPAERVTAATKKRAAERKQDQSDVTDQITREVEIRTIEAATNIMTVLQKGLDEINKNLVKSMDERFNRTKRVGRIALAAALISLLLAVRVEHNRLEALDDSCSRGNLLRSEISNTLISITGEPLLPSERTILAMEPGEDRDRLLSIRHTVDDALEGNLQPQDCEAVVDRSEIPAPWPISFLLHSR